jgi:hypothetical protein
MSSYDPASSRHRERRYDPEYEAELDAFNRAVLRAVGVSTESPTASSYDPDPNGPYQRRSAPQDFNPTRRRSHRRDPQGNHVWRYDPVNTFGDTRTHVHGDQYRQGVYGLHATHWQDNGVTNQPLAPEDSVSCAGPGIDSRATPWPPQNVGRALDDKTRRLRQEVADLQMLKDMMAWSIGTDMPPPRRNTSSRRTGEDTSSERPVPAPRRSATYMQPAEFIGNQTRDKDGGQEPRSLKTQPLASKEAWKKYFDISASQFHSKLKESTGKGTGMPPPARSPPTASTGGTQTRDTDGGQKSRSLKTQPLDLEEDWEKYHNTSASQFHRKSDPATPVPTEPAPSSVQRMVPTGTSNAPKPTGTKGPVQTGREKMPTEKPSQGSRPSGRRGLGCSMGDDPR